MTLWSVDGDYIVNEKGQQVARWKDCSPTLTTQEQSANALKLAAAPAAIESLQAIAKAMVRGRIVVDVSPDMSTNIMEFSKLMNNALVALTAAGINTEDLHR